MAKPWSVVEQSGAYQQLSPQAKIQAKVQYWDTVVSNKQDYITLPQESKSQAKSEFLGGQAVLDMPESMFRPRNVALATALGTAGTLGRSAGNLAKAVASPIFHPIATAKSIGGIAAGGVQKFIPGQQPQEKYIDAIGQFYKQRYGGVENIAETVANDPFGFIADVGTVGGLAGAGVRAGGRVAARPDIVRAGSFPATRQAGQTVVSGAKETAGRVISKVTKSPEKLAEEATSTYREILRPTQGEIRNIEIRKGQDINKYYRLAAEEGIPIKQTVEKGVGKLDNIEAIQSLRPKVEKVHEQLNFLLRSDKTKKFNLAEIGNTAKASLQNTISNADDLARAERDINRYISAEINRHGQVVDALTLNNIKQGMWSVGYSALRPTAKSTARKVGNVIKNKIEQAFPAENIRGLNTKSGDYQTLIHLLENAQGRVVKGGQLGQYFANVIGAVSGSKIPVVGPLAGAYIGGKVSKAMYAPERLSAVASGKMRQALARMPRRFNAEVVYPNIPVGEKAIGGPRPLQGIPYQTRALPPPRYHPAGYPQPPVKRMVTPYEQGGPAIQGQAPYAGTTLPALAPQNLQRVPPRFLTEAQKGKFKAGQLLRGRHEVSPLSIVEKTPRSQELGAALKKSIQQGKQGIVEAKLETITDVENLISEKAKQYGNRNAFLASEEYKKLYPQVEAIYLKAKNEYVGKATKAMEESGVKAGDRVSTLAQGFAGGNSVEGIVIMKDGVPYVKLDSPQMTSQGYRKQVQWNKGWKLSQPTEGNSALLAEARKYKTAEPVKVYYRTNISPEEIKKSGFKSLENTQEIFVSNKKEGQVKGYGENVIELNVNPKDLRLDDEFPGGEQHFAIKKGMADKYFQAQKEGQPVGEAVNPPAMPAPDASLKAEALKYKTAEEFVEGKANQFHGTDVEFETFDLNKSKAFGQSKFGHWFTEGKEFAGMFGKNVKETFVDVKNPKIISKDKWDDIRGEHAKDGEWFKSWKNELIQQGYDGLKVEGKKEMFGSQPVESQPIIAAFNDSQVKTKAQLQSLWHEAQEQSKKLGEALKRSQRRK